ncbi:hypothetical protein E2C01_011693 [Portunus trituberculatus]|uniref:Uncharacterized protein n=1 Tax=Portunus trituberculatus TaxID=210409 RepID=A0A5B7DBT4_PORTR|nr:hypothetical protein [Portunus trituberculatus]
MFAECKYKYVCHSVLAVHSLRKTLMLLASCCMTGGQQQQWQNYLSCYVEKFALEFKIFAPAHPAPSQLSCALLFHLPTPPLTLSPAFKT